MVNLEQNPSQQEQPFVDAKQVGFNLEDIILNTNNEVSLLSPEHNYKDHVKCVSDFISKCCLRKPFTRSPNMYKEYLAEFWYLAKTLKNSKVFFSTPTGGIYSEVGVNTFRKAIGAHYLPHSSEYVSPPSIDIVMPWFETIRYGQAVLAKGTLKKSLLPPRWRKGANSVARQIKEETSSSIKLEDLAKLVSHVQPSFKDLDSPEDDPVIVVDDKDEDKDDEVYATKILKLNTSSQKHKLEFEKNKAEAKADVKQLNELLVKSLKTKFSNIVSAHDFSSSLPTELKDLPSKLNDLTREVKGLKKQVHEWDIELLGDLKEIPIKLDDITKNVASVQAKLKTLDALPSLLLNVTQALNKFAQVLNSALLKVGDQSVLSAGQADTMPAEGKKNMLTHQNPPFGWSRLIKEQ
nr:hypothetical protein [Tanacetum cinerariifolium]